MKVDYDNLYKKMKQQYYNETLAHYNQVYEKAKDKNIAKQVVVAQLTLPYLLALNNPYIKELINLFDLNWRLGNSFNEVVKEIPALREKHIDLMKYREAMDKNKMEITNTQIKDNTISQNFSFISDSSYAFERELIDIDNKELLAYYAQYQAIREFIEYLGGIENILKEEDKNQGSLSQLSTIDEKEFTAKRRGLALHYLNKYYKLNKMQDVTILTTLLYFLLETAEITCIKF